MTVPGLLALAAERMSMLAELAHALTALGTIDPADWRDTVARLRAGVETVESVTRAELGERCLAALSTCHATWNDGLETMPRRYRCSTASNILGFLAHCDTGSGPRWSTTMQCAAVSAVLA